MTWTAGREGGRGLGGLQTTSRRRARARWRSFGGGCALATTLRLEQKAAQTLRDVTSRRRHGLRWKGATGAAAGRLSPCLAARNSSCGFVGSNCWPAPHDVGAVRSPSSQTAENVHRHAGSTESEAPDVPASIRTPFVSFLRMRAVRTTCAPVSPELLRAFCGGRKTQVLGFVHSGTSGVPVRARCMPHHALFDLRCVIDGQHVRSSGSHPLPHWRSNGSPSGCGPAKRRFPARRRADGCRAGCRLLLLLTYKDRLAHKTRITAN